MTNSAYTLKDYKTLVKQIWREEPMMSLTALRRFYPSINEHKMTEIMLIVSKKLGTYPEFTPVVPGAATPGIAAKAIEEVKKLP